MARLAAISHPLRRKSNTTELCLSHLAVFAEAEGVHSPGIHIDDVLHPGHEFDPLAVHGVGAEPELARVPLADRQNTARDAVPGTDLQESRLGYCRITGHRSEVTTQGLILRRSR